MHETKGLGLDEAFHRHFTGGCRGRHSALPCGEWASKPIVQVRRGDRTGGRVLSTTGPFGIEYLLSGGLIATHLDHRSVLTLFKKGGLAGSV